VTVTIEPLSIESLADMADADKIEPLINLAGKLAESPGDRALVIDEMVRLLRSGAGASEQRLALGDALGALGDPRLRLPSEQDYWATVPGDRGAVTLGRFPVTNWEFRKFIECGGYSKRSVWTEEGLAWLDGCDEPWPALAAKDTAVPFLHANQPVVGVTFYEASAYARFHDSRLPRWDERVWAVRGAERRPYPWGDPFGTGNANTKEEVLGRSCAVGLYTRDITPEGIHDLAGNVGEWTGDNVGGEILLHPGAWDQPSMAAWAKALTTAKAQSRWGGLGFRLAKN